MIVLFYNATVIERNRKLENGYVLVNGATIEGVGVGIPSELPESVVRIDCGGGILSPGFIDIHSHGGGGYDIMDGSPADIIGAARSHLVHGTTTYIPTSLTCPNSELIEFLEQFHEVQAMRDNLPHLPGVHLEGPYFAPSQAGAQPPEFLITPKRADYEDIFRHSHDHILRWSMAPELDGAMELGDACVERGILPAIGHSDADYDTVKESIRHGFTHVTHFYSCMSTITRRKGYRILGIIESAYLLDELTVEIIADGKHLPPELLRFICKFKDHEKITLVTDSMRGAGMPDGESRVGSLKYGTPCIIANGIANLTDFSAFAGSTATTDRLLRTMVNDAGVELVDAISMLTAHPAKLMKLDGFTGEIKQGYHADLVLLDKNLYPKRVWVDGVEAVNP